MSLYKIEGASPPLDARMRRVPCASRSGGLGVPPGTFLRTLCATDPDRLRAREAREVREAYEVRRPRADGHLTGAPGADRGGAGITRLRRSSGRRGDRG